MKRRIFTAAAAAALLVATGYSAGAASLTLSQTLAKPTPAAGDQFGFSVALSDNRALVGALFDDTGAPNAGAAYLFDTATGALLQTLANPTPAVGDIFGFSVALSGTQALVGAPNAGAAYLFDTSTGALLQTLANPTPAAGDQFGFSVALSGNRALVGALADDTGATNAGAAHLFDTNGTLLQTLANPTPALNDLFGFSVALSGTQALVGAIGDNTGARDAGAAYLFDTATGTLSQTLANPTPAAGDQFGQSVALSGSQALVGAIFDDTGAFDAGAAYLFDTATGTLLQTLANPTPAADDNFGQSVALSPTQALVGARLDDTGGVNAGAAHLYSTGVAPVPLPASASLFLAALGGLGLIRTRRRAA